jgi:hypothetical protein
LKLINNIFAGLFAKVFGLLLLIVINKQYGATIEVGKIIYYWSIAIFIQSVFLMPTLYYAISIRKAVFLIYERNIIKSLLLLLFVIFFIDTNIIPFVIWLIFLTINLRIDFFLLRTKHNIIFLYSYALKNILPLLFFYLISIEYVFYFFLLGEIIKTIIFKKLLNIKLNIDDYETKKLIIYIGYLFSIGFLFLLDKTFLYYYNAKLVIDYELAYRFFEIFLTALTTGLVPLFVNNIYNKNANEILKVSFALSVFIVLVVSVGLSFFGSNIYNYMNFTISLKDTIKLLNISIILLLPMVLLTYNRKKVALIVDKHIFLFYLGLILEKFSIFEILYILHIQNILMYIFINNLVLLIIENIFIFKFLNFKKDIKNK